MPYFKGMIFIARAEPGRNYFEVELGVPFCLPQLTPFIVVGWPPPSFIRLIPRDLA